MQKIGFAEAVERIIREDPRYHREVYPFVRDALDFTVKQQKKGGKPTSTSHVTPLQLLDGIRLYALKEFGPMVPTVFGYWNVQSCEDLGHIVFNMIRKEILGKNDTDTLDQFREGYDFHQAFVAPFLPPHPVPSNAPVPDAAPLPTETEKPC